LCNKCLSFPVETEIIQSLLDFWLWGFWFLWVEPSTKSNNLDILLRNEDIIFILSNKITKCVFFLFISLELNSNKVISLGLDITDPLIISKLDCISLNSVIFNILVLFNIFWIVASPLSLVFFTLYKISLSHTQYVALLVEEFNLSQMSSFLNIEVSIL
jgi:hypothetical protein